MSAPPTSPRRPQIYYSKFANYAKFAEKVNKQNAKQEAT